MIGAWIFVIAALLCIALHLVLILGAPVGFMTMGGVNPGVLPAKARAASAAQAAFLAASIAIVLQATGVLEFRPDLSWLIWVVVGVSALSLLGNSITSSKRERLFGVPASIGLLVGSALVALGE